MHESNVCKADEMLQSNLASSLQVECSSGICIIHMVDVLRGHFYAANSVPNHTKDI